MSGGAPSVSIDDDDDDDDDDGNYNNEGMGTYQSNPSSSLVDDNNYYDEGMGTYQSNPSSSFNNNTLYMDGFFVFSFVLSLGITPTPVSYSLSDIVIPINSTCAL